MVGMMDTANHCLAVRNNVGFITSNKLADRHDNSSMLGGNRGLRETFRKGILESPEYGFNLYCCTTSDSKDPYISKQTGPVSVDRLPRVPEETVWANRFSIDETLGLTERPAWNRGRLPTYARCRPWRSDEDQGVRSWLGNDLASG